MSDVNIEDVDSSVDIRVFSTETNSSILAGGLAGTTNTADGTVFFKDCAVSGNLTSIQYLHSLGGIIAHGGNGSAPHVVIDGCTYSGTIEYGQGNIPADGSGKPLTAGRIGGLIGDVSRIVTIRNSSTLAGTAINVRLNGWTLGNGGIGGLAGRSTSNKDGYTMQLTFEGSCTNNADITVFDMLSEERDWCNQVLGRQGKAPAGSGVASGSCSYASSSVPGAMVGSFRLCQLTGRRTSSMTNLSGISKTVGTNEMAYVLVTSGGKVIVIDGGYPENLPTLRDIINSNGGHVDLWFVSHPHEDHYSALLSLLDDMNGITIGKIVYSRVEAWSSELYDKLDASHSGVDEIVDVQMPGQRFDIDNIGIKVLSVAERYLDSNQNNSSMVLRVWDSGKVVVFLGDAGVPLGRKLLSDCKADLDCDYLQIAHHGNKGCEEFFYRNVRFDYALVPTADWIWHAELYNASMPDNLDGGITRSWIEDILPSANIITSYEHPDWWLEPVGSFVMDGYVEGGLIDYFN